jgi:ligand-binding sensor domain-containing protein/signal transduction histidine kinase
MRTFWMVVFVLACYSVALGQKDSYALRNYKAVDGLPQSNVNIMLEDRNGYLWIGTHGGGLARFDGREFKVYTTRDGLLSNIVTYLKLDLDHNLWIVHARGITKFDGLKFSTFKQPGTPSNSRRIRRIFEYSDTLFFTSGLGDLGKIHNDSVYYWSKPFLKNFLVRYYHLTPDKSILMYLNDSSFYVRSQKGEYAFTHEKKFDRPLQMFNYKNDVWVETDKGYFTVDFSKRDFIKRDLPIDNHVVYYDSINDVFWTHRNMALLKEKINGEKVEIDTAITDIDVSQVLVDAEGSTWFATAGTGLYKYFLQDFIKYNDVNLRSVSSVLVDKQGATWVSSSRGLWKITGDKVKSYFDSKDQYRNVVYTIKESPDGEIWIGTAYGLGKLNSNTDRFDWYTRDQGLSSSTVSSIEFDLDGGLWAGTLSGGLNHFDGKAFTPVTIRQGLPSNAHFSQHHKKLFVGNEFGVSVIENNKVQSFTITGMENTSIISIQPFRDSLLLIGSSGAGIAIYNPRTRVKKVLSTHDGLASDFIYFAAADEKNYIWIGTEKGITKIRVNAGNEIVENLHYDFDNGLTGVETNQNAFFLSKDKKFFGLIDGLYQFNQSRTNKSRSFGIHLTDIEIFYGQDSVRQFADSLVGFFKLPYKPSLPPEKNHITFVFNKVDKRYPKSVKFRYFLENFDKTWSQPSSNHFVTYGNLPPGSYSFKVVATNSQGSWSAPFSYSFSVKTPFYQTASFIVGMFVLLAGAITLILYLRVKQRVNQVMMLERIRAREQETLRKEIARDFHDEMGNQLTRIINYVSLLRLNAETNGNGSGNGHGSLHGNGQDLYTKVENSAKYLYTGTRDFIWSIDPGNDELSKLFIHIRDFGEKLFEEKSINFRAFNEVKEKMKLPYGFSREANLIFKEAMTNAFKYSCAANVTLSLSRQNDEFSMSFEDDGIGFSTGEIQKTNGLKNIRDRADRIHAVLRIHSGKKQGTKIVLQFKLNKTLKYGLTV